MKISKLFFNVFKVLILAVFIGILVEFFGYKGLLGYIILVSLFGLYRLYQYRDQFMSLIRDTESLLFGKPLDKEMWDEGEKPKLKKMRFKK